MMITKRWIGFFSLLLVIFLLTFVACKKKQAFKSEDGQDCVDTQNLQGENDAAINDANSAMGDQAILSGRSASSSEKSTTVLGVICGLTVDTTQMSSGILTLNYGGIVCNNRKREGQIKLTVLNYPTSKWKQVGCIVKMDYINYKITRASDGKSVQFNGSVNLTNQNGGTWIDLLFFNKASLVHLVQGNNIKVKFDGNKNAEYNIHRRYTYTFATPLVNNVATPILTVKGEGLGTNDGRTNLENWGTTRNGDAFTSEVTSPVIWNSTCGSKAPIDGGLTIRVDSKDFELKCLFGVTSGGSPASPATNQCAYGWKLDWKYKNKSKSRIFPY